MVLNTYIVTASDPTDPTVALYRLIKHHDSELASTKNVETMTRSAKKTIDQNAIYFCEICKTNVMKNSKHCA